MIFFTMSLQESTTTMLIDMPVDCTSTIGFQLIAHGSNRLHVSNQLSSQLLSLVVGPLVDRLFEKLTRVSIVIGSSQWSQQKWIVHKQSVL